jgi:hypothetical protein
MADWQALTVMMTTTTVMAWLLVGSLIVVGDFQLLLFDMK